ncbi:hypothetical protein PPSIR1_25746 [Plesiocystis pacifica SIR-1]|uniref:Bacterial virulence factor lipase N-terminal domain-containing protein n=2 Tax=Plesiocystis pacifica TaxID=191768 RepID=A6FZG3_9BACT|nr:hypothetical protein PPSIR1_25746 [Plesiocystis pacifica SIR-1]
MVFVMQRLPRLAYSTFLFPLASLALVAATSTGCADDSGNDDEVGETSQDTETSTDSDTETSTDAETTDTDSSTTTGEPDPAAEWPTLDCDPLVPDYCAFPFPSNVFTSDDADSPTGRRVALVGSSLPNKGAEIVPDVFNRADGFSPGQAPMTYMPNAANTGLARWDNIELSMTEDSPTVMINAETGEWVPHFAEVDVSFDADPEDGALMLRPVVRLDDATRYIVAIRNVENDDGEVIPPTEAFLALRDVLDSDDESVEARRPLYADIFQRLGDAGVPRDDLQIAWDFTTASEQHNTGDLLHMRDDALGQYPEGEGPSYTITNVDSDWEPDNIAFRIQGVIEVPLYLDDPGPGGLIVRGDDGMPEYQGTAEYGFTILIPHSAVDTPAPVLQYGHGLLGGHTELQSGHLRSFINEYNYILFGTDWAGMATEDIASIAPVLATGSAEQFQAVTDRLQQGLVNFVALTRMMKTSMAEDPDYGQYIDPSAAYYLGISQGGIFGGTFMAISQDIERGCLGVPGQPYNLLLNRSVDFTQYFDILKQGYTDGRDLQIILALMQMLWDHAEPTGYSHRVTNDPFPNTPAHDVLIRAAVGDHQVTNLGAHLMSRAVGAAHLDTGIRDLYGLDPVMMENTGSTYVEYDFGLPPDPIDNLPQEACNDPHGELRKLEEARLQLDTFFQTGVVTNTCTDGVCSFPELSGC